MSITVDTINLRFNVKPDYDQQLLSSASQLFSAMQQRETAEVDAKYKKLIAAAKKQGKDTTKLEEKMEAEKAEIQKKYADKQFQMNVLQIVASTAAGIARLWKDLPFYAALPLTVVVAASGAMQPILERLERHAAHPRAPRAQHGALAHRAPAARRDCPRGAARAQRPAVGCHGGVALIAK